MAKRTISSNEYFEDLEELLDSENKTIKNILNSADAKQTTIEPAPEHREIVVIEQTPNGPVKHIFRGNLKVIGNHIESRDAKEELGSSNSKRKLQTSKKLGSLPIYSEASIGTRPDLDPEINIKKADPSHQFYEEEDVINWKIEELKRRKREVFEVKINPKVMGKDIKIPEA